MIRCSTTTRSARPARSKYVVRLLLVEPVWPAAGQRVFSLTVDGAAAPMATFDIVRDCGPFNLQVRCVLLCCWGVIKCYSI